MHRHVKIEKFINIQLFIPSFLFYSSSNFCFLKFYSKIFLLSELVSFTLLLLIRRIFLLKGIMFSTWTITLLYLSVIIREINHAIENYYCITVTVKYSLILAIIEYLRNIIAHFIFLFLKFLKIFKLLTNFQIFFFPSFSQQQNICCFTTKAHLLILFEIIHSPSKDRTKANFIFVYYIEDPTRRLIYRSHVHLWSWILSFFIHDTRGIFSQRITALEVQRLALTAFYKFSTWWPDKAKESLYVNESSTTRPNLSWITPDFGHLVYTWTVLPLFPFIPASSNKVKIQI